MLIDRIKEIQGSAQVNENLSRSFAALEEKILTMAKDANFEEITIRTDSSYILKKLQVWAETNGLTHKTISQPLGGVGLCISWGFTSQVFSSFDLRLLADGRLQG
jgi:hypothetical protein